MEENISVTGARRIEFHQIIHKGIPLFNCEIDKIENMEIFDDDVWICGYPRSGLPLIVYQVIIHIKFTLIKENLVIFIK